MQKRFLKDPFQYCAASQQGFFPKCMCRAAVTHPFMEAFNQRLAACLLRPTLTTTSITVGCGQPTTRNGCTRQLLVLAEGMGEGKGQGAFARTLGGHSFSRKGGGNCHPRAAHSTKIKEIQKEVGAVGLDPLRQRRDLNLGNLLSG